MSNILDHPSRSTSFLNSILLGSALCKMSDKSVISNEAKGPEQVPAGGKATPIRHGEQVVEAIDDPEVSDFYDGAVSQAYRRKSELVAKHLAEIGMGK